MAHRIRIRVRPPFIQVLVQKSVTTITNFAGRLSLGCYEMSALFRKCPVVKSWKQSCWDGKKALSTCPLTFCSVATCQIEYEEPAGSGPRCPVLRETAGPSSHSLEKTSPTVLAVDGWPGERSRSCASTRPS